MLNRRSLLKTSVTAIPAIALGGCGLFTQNANGSYGLSQAVLTVIQSTVQTIAQYAPSIESIAATAASLFGPVYTAIVTIGSTAINQVISYLENLVASPPTVGARLSSKAYARLGIPLPTGSLVGYTKSFPNGTHGIPVFAS